MRIFFLLGSALFFMMRIFFLLGSAVVFMIGTMMVGRVVSSNPHVLELASRVSDIQGLDHKVAPEPWQPLVQRIEAEGKPYLLCGVWESPSELGSADSPEVALRASEAAETGQTHCRLSARAWGAGMARLSAGRF